MTHRHTERAEMAREVWAENVYPVSGDTGALLFGVQDGPVIMMVSQQHPVAMIHWLLASQPPPTEGFLEWVGWVGTCYTDDAPTMAAAQEIAGNLGEQPTPTTKHGLVVTIASRDGFCSSTGWQLDLGDPLVWGEQIIDTDDGESCQGDIPAHLLTLLVATT